MFCFFFLGKDGQPSAENNEFPLSDERAKEKDEFKEVGDQDKQNTTGESNNQAPGQGALTMCPTEQEKLHLTDHSEKPIQACPDPVQIPTGLGDQTAENVLNQEAAEGMLTVETSQVRTDFSLFFFS